VQTSERLFGAAAARIGVLAAKGLVQRLPVLEVVRDVFDPDFRIVDQDADRELDAAQGHDVDGLAEFGQRDHRRQHAVYGSEGVATVERII